MSLEPPYGFIWKELSAGKVVPFLGAGASFSGRPAGAEWDDESPTFLPSGSELARRLAEESSFPSDTPGERHDLAKVASYYLEAIDRDGLFGRLCELFDRDYQIGAVHRFLADLEAPLLIITTNYDDLIERAFREKSKPFHLVVHPTDQKELAGSVLWWKPEAAEPEPYPPNTLPLSLKETSIIYKMHGSIDRQGKRWDSFVITEEDYVDFLARMIGQSALPKRLMAQFRSARFLFLGYSLSDWNLRVMLKNLKAGLVRSGPEPEPQAGGRRRRSGTPPEDLRSWAIQSQPSALERVLWDARKVNIYDLTIDDFVVKLKEQMA